jgi:CelD/BcsL family acetyltransferase involved in cellulose biosynthesis
MLMATIYLVAPTLAQGMKLDRANLERANSETTRGFSSAPLEDVRTMTVRDLDGLQPHREAWDRLAWEAPQGLATMLPAWVEATFRYGLWPHWRWMCCFAYAGERLIGVMPVVITPHPILGHRRPLLRTYSKLTTSGDIALAPDCAAEALKALLEEVARQEPRHVGLDLQAVRQNSPIWSALRDGAAHHLVRSSACHGFSILDVSGSFESFIGNLKRMSSDLGRYHRKIKKRGKVRIEIVTGPHARADFLPQFLALEAAGWKGRCGGAILNNPDSLAFHTALVENFAAEGRLAWHLIWVDDTLVGAQLALRCNRSLMLPKYTFNEDFAECRVGTLLTEAAFRDGFAQRELHELNPMSKAQAHAYWHLPEEKYVDVHLVRRAAVAMLFHLPRVWLRKAYWTHIRPRVPEAARKLHLQFKRHGGRKPKRAAEVQPTAKVNRKHTGQAVVLALFLAPFTAGAWSLMECGASEVECRAQSPSRPIARGMIRA